MLEYVLETFLRDAVEAGRDIQRKRLRDFPLHVLDLQTGSTDEVIDLVSDRCL